MTDGNILVTYDLGYKPQFNSNPSPLPSSPSTPLQRIESENHQQLPLAPKLHHYCTTTTTICKTTNKQIPVTKGDQQRPKQRNNHTNHQRNNCLNYKRFQPKSTAKNRTEFVKNPTSIMMPMIMHHYRWLIHT